MYYAGKGRKVGDMIINFRVHLNGSFRDIQLTTEELSTLEKSCVCLNCTHRDVFHNRDSVYGIECSICQCDEFIKEGDFSYRNIHT